MKVKVSISIEESTLKLIEEKIQDGTFRNKSHFIEFAAKKKLEESCQK